jgi:hypothetical protein
LLSLVLGMELRASLRLRDASDRSVATGLCSAASRRAWQFREGSARLSLSPGQTHEAAMDRTIGNGERAAM